MNHSLNHSPLPWKIDGAEDLPLAIIQDVPDGYGVCEMDTVSALAHEDAAFIVHACNNIERIEKENAELVEALKVTNEQLSLWFRLSTKSAKVTAYPYTVSLLKSNPDLLSRIDSAKEGK